MRKNQIKGVDNEVDMRKNKKPVIKKNKLDLKKRQIKRDTLKNSNPNIISSSILNNKINENKQKSQKTKQKNKKRTIWPNQKTFENFLLANNIKFLKRDTVFILRDLGSLGDCLYEDRFKRFVFSNVWEP